jgi:protein gp37
MSDQRKDGISWTDETWNPVRGCSKVSDGCKFCYAESMAARFSGPGMPYEGLIMPFGASRWTGTVKFMPEKLDAPLRWKRPRRIFVNSMSDFLHPDITDEQVAEMFGVMAVAATAFFGPRIKGRTMRDFGPHVFQLLTKRAGRLSLLGTERFRGMVARAAYRHAHDRVDAGWLDQCISGRREWGNHCTLDKMWPLPNVHLGVSCENQAAADERIPLLLQCPAAVRWVSAEPLLGAIDFGAEYLTTKLGTYPFPAIEREHRTKLIDLLDWIVCGGESGPHARPMHPDWARSIRDQCKAAGVPFHFKQHGEWLPGGFYDGFTVPDCMGAAMNNPKNMHYFEPPGGKCWRVGKKQAGHLLDGREYRMWPGDHW